MSSARTPPLQGKRILVVEDEALIAMEVEGLLKAAGASVAGPAGREAKALDLLDREQLDAAVLDLNLNGQPPVSLAEALARKQVPFVILSGYAGSKREEPCLQNAPRLNKPVNGNELVDALCLAMGLSTAST